MELTVNDFFCGAGGFSIGFKNAGFDVVGAWDWEELQVSHYRTNVDDNVKNMDITKMNWADVPVASCWTYGFPCQDLTRNGNMKGLIDGDRSKMFFEVMRLLDETIENAPENLPEVIMAENVEDLRKYIPVLVEEYAKRGYKAHIKLFNSKFWGVAQNRKRFFVIGVRDDRPFPFPEEKPEITVTLADILEENADPGLVVEIDTKLRQLIWNSPRDHLLVRQATKKGYDIAFPGDSINTAFPTSGTRRGRVGKKVAQTLLTGREQVVVLPDLSVRYFTDREVARLQGFPDDYKFNCTSSQVQELMGNAVTVNVAEAIAEKIKEYLAGK